MTKRKVHKSFEFPTSLTLKDDVYYLCAVLQHKGNTAYAGHYIVDLYNFQYPYTHCLLTLRLQSWFRCDDTSVKKLDNIFEHPGTLNSKRSYSSKTACMLMYTRTIEPQPVTLPEFQQEVMDMITMENATLKKDQDAMFEEYVILFGICF